MRTLITNGTVVNADGSYRADVLIEDDKIAAVGLIGQESIAGQALSAVAKATIDRTIDAVGRWVIPGGIDTHTHMELPFGGTASKDTFETGTRAAAFGGTTTILDFAVQSRGESLRSGLDAWMAKAEGNCAIDYGFHMIMSDVNEQSLKEMDTLVAEGVTDFKLFTAYPGVFLSDDADILRAMLQTRENGGLILMHAENGVAIDVIADRNVAAGNTDPYYHGASRYPVFEGECVNRVIRFAEAAEVPVYIVHLSSRDALEELQRGRARGAMAFAETCPQYLYLSLDDMGNGFEGAKFVCSPPLRPADHQEDLWQGLVKGDLQTVGTDHCPFDFEGQKDLGRGDFRKVPNGLPGVEERMDLMYQGVVAGRMSKERWVEICSTSAARLFGMANRKGVVAPGADADIVIYDPERKHVLSASTHHMNVDYSCYEGLEVQGGSDIVLSRGKVVVEKGEYKGTRGDGQFLERDIAREYLK
ncbi:MAG: dihydropyrimidinase [Chloroflexota bacterium]